MRTYKIVLTVIAGIATIFALGISLATLAEHDTSFFETFVLFTFPIFAIYVTCMYIVDIVEDNRATKSLEGNQINSEGADE